MTHWGWYWRIKRQNYNPKPVCSKFWLDEIDSFSMFNDYHRIEKIRSSESKWILEIPRYDLKVYTQGNDSLLVKCVIGSYTIPVEKKPCNYGGFYYFFHCPLCGRRMRKLYCILARYQCRKCGNLGYYTQRLRPEDRMSHMQYMIEKLVKSQDGNINYDQKPPRMHKKTFEKLKEKAAYFKAKSGLACFKEIREIYGAKVEELIETLDYEYKMIVEDYERKHKN